MYPLATPGRAVVCNAALGQMVIMSSTWVGENGVFATDGAHTQCAVTGKAGSDPQPFIEVDLVGASRASIIKSIRVWNTATREVQFRLVHLDHDL